MTETTIQMIAQAIIANTKVLQSLVDALPHDVKQSVAEVVHPTPAPAPAVKVAEPSPGLSSMHEMTKLISEKVEPAPVAAAPAMPAPPTFEAPAPAPVASAVPFHDSKSLIDYVMGVYKVLGPQKGAGIQNVLTSLGYQNINDVKSEHYAALHAGIEALKG